nr:aminoglycoside phosphotransferase family protein [Deinococcus hopiensis]
MTFHPYMQRWHLVSDGLPIYTRSSDLLPVRYGGQAAMLEIARGEEEKTGNAVMAWWDGAGAARVWQHDAEAVLLERVEGNFSLTEMVSAGRDDEATRILCRLAGALHRNGTWPGPELPSLERWFRGLEEMAPGVGGVLAHALETALSLLRKQQDVRVLHGDIQATFCTAASGAGLPLIPRD